MHFWGWILKFLVCNNVDFVVKSYEIMVDEKKISYFGLINLFFIFHFFFIYFFFLFFFLMLIISFKFQERTTKQKLA